MNCRSKIKQIVCRSLVFLGTIISVLLFIPTELKAQLKPWDYTNQVFIDLSVINDTSDLRLISPYASVNPLLHRRSSQTSFLLRDLDSQLLEPPKQKPRSSFLLKRPKKTITNTPKSHFKLISPQEYKRRSNAAKRLTALNRNKKFRKMAPKRSRKADSKTRVAKTKTITKVESKPAIKPSLNQTKKVQVVKAGEIPPPPKITPPAPPEPKVAKVISNIKEAEPEKLSQNIKKPDEKQQVALPSTVDDNKLINVMFTPGGSDLNEVAKKTLNTIATKLTNNENIRMQLMAYAGEAKMSASKARRLSLSRALAIRSYLIGKGIRGTRIDVRALGNKISSGLPNRVDLRVFSD